MQMEPASFLARNGEAEGRFAVLLAFMSGAAATSINEMGIISRQLVNPRSYGTFLSFSDASHDSWRQLAAAIQALGPAAGHPANSNSSSSTPTLYVYGHCG